MVEKLEHTTLTITGIKAEITINDLGKRNTISLAFLRSFHCCIDRIESNPSITLVVIRSAKSEFCVGMDFEEFTENLQHREHDNPLPELYMRLLTRLSQMDKLVVACIEGSVLAGGVGLAVASDIVIATKNSSFSLPEIIWGLVPSNVLPFLIRRVGFQVAYKMTLTGEVLSATKAEESRLIDILADDIDSALRMLLIRAERLQCDSIADVKHYFRQLWYVGYEQEHAAVEHLKSLLMKERVRNNISNYVTKNQFPWQAAQTSN